MNTIKLHAWKLALAGLVIGSALFPFLTNTLFWSPANPRRNEPEPVAELNRGPRGANRIALTFDAGGETDAFPALLTALADARVHCTFFLTGRWMRDHSDLVALLVNAGHELGNHTWSHRDLTRLNDEQIRTELHQTGTLLGQHVAGRVSRWWRAPFGERNQRVLRIASELGYVSVYWTLDSLDSVAPVKSRAFLVERVTHQSNAELEGAIILMHVGEPATAEALPEILANFQRRGIEVVTVSGLMTSADTDSASAIE